MEIRSDIINLTASLPIVMKYGDVCSALGISDKYLYKLLDKKKIMYINLTREKRIPRAFFVAYLVEGINCPRTKSFISKIYKDMLSCFPEYITINQVCNVLRVSKSTVKRMINNNELDYFHYHDTLLIYIYKDSLLRYMINHTIK